MDEQAFADIGSALSGITAAHSPAGASGTFSYTPEALSDLIAEWQSMADDYRISVKESRSLVAVQGPGTEYASRSHATMANISGQAYAASLNEKLAYCLAQAQKLQDTLDDYLGVEHHNISQINQRQSQDGI
jgi:hypothetical protein